ncbi:outer membrane protein assembly factor BamB family protein [Flavobacterium sharifuzzamanii]|uniref:outer membrane protein assembly factor BamB family protein n=1 Tax=Flavobacterium sharifuzzamanii TaxID=2211133 RepID=UPI000DAC5288|nr:PQQ-binding-like beta-propeller repeat protein [Flavobacterium sharifuzzamanii]KAF2079773.1 PQQ-like beta-propeller repeat protein [Flavobacterium sharifuzzamanii]
MKRNFTFLLLYFFLIFTSNTYSQNKSDILNPFSNRIFSGKGYQPLQDLKWKFKTEGKIFSSPIAQNGTVYIGSEDGYFYAVDEKSGTLKWKFKTNGAIHSSASIYNDIVFFGSFDGHYYAVNAKTGKEMWRFKTKGEHWYSEVGMWGMKPSDLLMADLWDFYLSTPVIYFDNKSALAIFGSSDGNMYAVDGKTGTLKWNFETKAAIHSTPVLDKSTLYFGGWDGIFYALDCKTGKEKWKFTTEIKTGFTGIQASATVYDGMVYFGARDPYMFALDAETGKVIWKYDAENSWILSTAVVKDNILYVGTSDTYALLALDPKTGKEKYRFKGNGYVYSSPAIAGNTIYFGDFTGNFFDLNLLSDGKESHIIPTENRTKYAGSTLKNNLLDFGFVAQKADLSIYSENQKVLDEFYKLGSIVSSPFISNNVIFYGSADGYLYAYNLKKQK